MVHVHMYAYKVKGLFLNFLQAKSSHAATSPDIPAMIKTLEILPPFPSEIYPVISALTVPLCDQLEASVDLTCDVPAGNRRRLHAAASSVECVKKWVPFCCRAEILYIII